MDIAASLYSSLITHHSSLKNYPPELLRDVEGGLGRVRGPPGEVAARGVAADAAEEVAAPARARARRAPERLPRDAQSGRDRAGADARRRLHPGAEVPVGVAPFIRDREREVEPLARRRHLELVVAPDALGLGRDENLAHVPV